MGDETVCDRTLVVSGGDPAGAASIGSVAFSGSAVPTGAAADLRRGASDDHRGRG